jgi:hypothetical protein
MKAFAVLAAVGGALGAAVAVIAHFMTNTLPDSFTFAGVVGVDPTTSDYAPIVTTPMIHPSWWPILPFAIAIGLVIDLVVGIVGYGSGLRLVRRPASEPNDYRTTHPETTGG